MATSRSLCVVGALAVLVAGEGAARAYDKGAADAAGWRFELQPYVSIPMAISGDATVFDRSVPVDVSAGDLLDKLKLAAELRFEAWNGRWGIVGGGAFAKLGDSKDRPELTFDLTTRSYAGDASVAFRLGRSRPGTAGPSLAVDIMAGAQVIRVSETLDIDSLSRTAAAVVAKGIGQARAIVRLSPSWAIVVRSLVGGPDFVFGIGGAAELDVSRFAIRLGYSYQQINYSSSSDRLRLDVSTHGPYLGVGIRFGAGPIF